MYTDAVYDLRLCMKEDNSSPNYFKGVVRDGVYPLVIKQQF